MSEARLRPKAWRERGGLGLALCYSAALSTACAGDAASDGEPVPAPTFSPRGAAESSEAACEPEALSDELIGGLPSGLALQGEHVYWIEERSGELRRVAKAGGTREVIATGMAREFAGVAADADYVFVSGADAQIHRIVPDGSENVGLADTGGDFAYRLQVVPPYLYWLSQTGGPSDSYAGQVRRVRTDGTGAAEVLWSSSGEAFAHGLAVSGDDALISVFDWPIGSYTLRADGRILRVSGAGDAGVRLVTDLWVPEVHAADNRYVYFSAQTAEYRENELWRVAIGGGPAELLRSAVEYPVEVDGPMVIRGDTVWWGGSQGEIFRLTAGSQPFSVAKVGAHHMPGLAADDTHLYFSSSYSFDAIGPAAIWRIPTDCTRR